ncbi:glycosyl hydrolase family 76 [Seiridium cupressi]
MPAYLSVFINHRAWRGLTFKSSENTKQYSRWSDRGIYSSIKQAASQVAEDLMSFYTGDQPGKVPGILPGPPPDGDYYWWIGGALWGTLLDYRFFTSDKTYDDTIMQAMTFQVGEEKDYMPKNWSASMGNDDQAFWALAALNAAETGFTDPPADTKLDWLALAQAVFNEQTKEDRRIYTGRCSGLLRWQAFRYNNGFDYINTIPNTCYFNIGARLARYFDNDTLADFIGTTYDLLKGVEYIDDVGNVYDGGHEGNDCQDINHQQFSYNPALLLQGLAHLYNMSDGADRWKTKLDFLLPRTLEFFFPNGTAVEPACEEGGTCTTDMLSFKGFLHRWLQSTAFLAPYLSETITPILKSSAQAAVSQCTGGSNSRMCGFKWASGTFDGKVGACQQMSVLAALISLLPNPDTGLLTNNTGGTSKGDPDAGSDLESHIDTLPDITTGDKAGAAVVTIIVLGLGLATFAWLSL